MARYIDADALGIGKADRNSFTTPEYADGWNSAIEIIANAPTADVVEVVRCKDCKYKTVTSDGEYNPEDIVCGYFMSDGFGETDYCSYGERVE